MDRVTAKEILASLDQDALTLLETIHARYFYFAGMMPIVDDACREQAEKDRVEFSQLLVKTQSGAPQITNEHIATFMNSVSGLPLDWCQAWDEVDFGVTHGLVDSTTAECAA